jgi:hypothetical protein
MLAPSAVVVSAALEASRLYSQVLAYSSSGTVFAVIPWAIVNAKKCPLANLALAFRASVFARVADFAIHLVFAVVANRRAVANLAYSLIFEVATHSFAHTDFAVVGVDPVLAHFFETRRRCGGGAQ